MNVKVIIDMKQLGTVLAGAAVGYIIGRREKKKAVAPIYETDPESYNRIYDVTTSTSWTKDHQMNLTFLKCQEDFVNHLLELRGHVMLNDVYDTLGMNRTAAGAVVGWIKSEGKHIDFGVKELPSLDDERPTIFLDFNVQGLAFDKI